MVFADRFDLNFTSYCIKCAYLKVRSKNKFDARQAVFSAHDFESDVPHCESPFVEVEHSVGLSIFNESYQTVWGRFCDIFKAHWKVLP